MSKEAINECVEKIIAKDFTVKVEKHLNLS